MTFIYSESEISLKFFIKNFYQQKLRMSYDFNDF